MYGNNVLEREQSNAQYAAQQSYVDYSSRVAANDMTYSNVNNQVNYYGSQEQYVSDNIDTNVSAYNYQAVSQYANQFAQAPTYEQYAQTEQYEQEFYPAYEQDPRAYNNTNVNVQTRPTQYYFPGQYQQQNVGYDYGYNQKVENNQEQLQYVKVGPTKTKSKSLNKVSKALIATYFIIVAICAALILVNVIAAASTTEVSAAGPDKLVASILEDNIYYAVAEDGSVVELSKTAPVIEYKYNTDTNWFDKLCDKIGELLG